MKCRGRIFITGHVLISLSLTSKIFARQEFFVGKNKCSEAVFKMYLFFLLFLC